MTLSVTARALTSDAPELASEVWRDFAGADEARREVNRQVLLAHLDVIANQRWIASAVDEAGRIVGLAIGIVEVHPSARRILGTALPGTISRGVWVNAGADPRTVGELLLRALCDVAAAHGVSSVVVPCLDEDDAHADAIAAAARAIGGREVTSPPNFVLDLAGRSTLASYLEMLPAHDRREFRRDLRRIETLDAVIESDRDADAATIARAWPFFADTLRRYSRLEVPPSDALLQALARRCGESLRIYLMRIGDGDQGAAAWVRAGDSLASLYIGHLDRKEVYPYFSLLSTAVLREVERATRQVDFGPAFDMYKKRVGCAARPQKRFVIMQRTTGAANP